MTRRIVTSSDLTIVHSSWVRELLRERFGEVRVEWLPLAADLSDPPGGHLGDDGPVVFGVFGGINHYKRLSAVVEAFADVAAGSSPSRLVIAGRADDEKLEQSLRAFVDDRGLGESVEFHTDVALTELDRLIAASDVVLALRWPTAGEMSATLMRALGAGRPVMVTDLPQFVDLDPAFAWRVPVDGERRRLRELMEAAVGDPALVRAAGIAARRYVEERATFARVAEEYHRMLQESA
jgi:glycosyltransferase involved in cell wall biosynthesis